MGRPRNATLTCRNIKKYNMKLNYTTRQFILYNAIEGVDYLLIHTLLLSLIILLLSECNVEANVHTCIRAERYKLLAHLAEQVVHAHKHVETLGMNIHNPSTTCREAIHCKIHTTIKPLQRSHICAKASLGPCVFAIKTSRTQKSELERSVERESLSVQLVPTDIKPSASIQATIFQLLIPLCINIFYFGLY